jgi:hypothetical protein
MVFDDEDRGRMVVHAPKSLEPLRVHPSPDGESRPSRDPRRA